MINFNARSYLGARSSGSVIYTSLGSEQRTATRTAISLPILIVLGGKRYSALLQNLSSAGAMILTSAPLAVPRKIDFHCGTISARGAVLWQSQSDFGIKFTQPISDRQISEQISRSTAVAARRAPGSGLSIVRLA